MALPFLPGNNFDKHLGRIKFHKSHHLDVCNKVGHLYGDDKPGIGGDLLSGQKIHAPRSTIPPGTGSDLPAWIAFDNQVLAFDGYFQESVNESRVEQYRVRPVKIYFYLQDDSMQIVEPRLRNSCLQQGTLTRRHRIPKPAPLDHLFYRADDLNIGVDLFIYGRVLKLTNCDEFTRKFMQKLGVRMNCPIQIPADPYMDNRKAVEETLQPLRPYDPMDTLKQFLDHDRHVLRFYCFWDDRDNMFGDLRYMVLHYYLADDTMEFHEIRARNCGRGDIPTLVSRRKIPKMIEPHPVHGQIAKRTVLNVLGSTMHGYFINDQLGMGALHRDFYKAEDLRIGTLLNVYNRRFVIYDCDDFTKEYYRVKFGITDFCPMEPVREEKQPKPKRFVPPYNGFGSEEDSLGNCLSVIPKPPQRDFVKFMEHDRRGHDSQTVRFTAKLVTDVAVDKDRRFILSFYQTDDTMEIFEPVVRNSGFWSGKFLRRIRVKKPNQPLYPVEFSKYYTLCDLYVGAVLDINKFKFQIVDADEYAYNYMEKRNQQYPQSDLCTTLSKLKAALDPQRDRLNYDQLEQRCVPFDEFCCLMKSITHDTSFTEHDIITLARHYQEHKENNLSLSVLLGIVQGQLKRANWEDFEYIEEQCLHHDNVRCGLLEQHVIRGVFNALKVPVQRDIVHSLISTVARAEDGLVDYPQLTRLVNWRCYPAPPIKMQPVSCESGQKTGTAIQDVDVMAIMEHINVLRPAIPHPCDRPEPPRPPPPFDQLRHNNYDELCCQN